MDENVQLRQQGEMAGAEQQEEGNNLYSCSREDSSEVRTAGRRCCMLHMLWMPADSDLFNTDVHNGFGTIISELEASRSAEEDSKEFEDPTAAFWSALPSKIADPIDVVWEVVCHLEIGLGKQWFEPWFKRQFKLGVRKMWAEAVNKVANQRHIVFKLTAEEFG
ncbi:hypothetical protein FRC12_024621 [Ceratobasidium sp. 428]|nr:hypothetical protein FRC12_024621 [Ceratobasidium sp. 428]